jgi:hypothetical protein
MMAAAVICGLIVACSLLALTICDAEAGNATATPVNNSTITPTPAITPTPIPAQRQVFFDARWDMDHVSVQVNNNGPAITVEASIGSLSNKITTQVDTGYNVKVLTQAINAKNGDIIRYWFKAYEGSTLIDSMEGSVQVEAKPTVPPETAKVSGIVKDSVTKEPIVGAKVVFKSTNYSKEYDPIYTSESGRFTTPYPMYPDTLEVTIDKSGYDELITNVYVLPGGTQDITQPLYLNKIGGQASTTPTPTPGPTPSPTPGSPVDAWVNLLYNPTVCISTLALTLGAIVSATAIYEWMLRQRERRKKEGEKK